MASHGYRQPYRQGPAPSLQQQRQQQPYHQNQNDRMNQYGGQQGRNYQQQSYDYNQYEPTQNRDQYDNHYGYDGRQFGNEPHHEPAYQDQYDEQFQQYDADSGRQQLYQHDDSHYSNGPTSPSAQYQQMRPLPHAGPPRHPAQNAQYVNASNAPGVKPSKGRNTPYECNQLLIRYSARTHPTRARVTQDFLLGQPFSYFPIQKESSGIQENRIARDAAP